MSKETSKLPSSLVAHNPWQKKSNPIWPATSFNLKRNIAKFNFPSRLTKEEMSRLLALLAKAHLKVLGQDQGQFLPAEELPILDKEFLFEHFLYEESFQNILQGQGVVFSLDGHFLALFNVHDHISLQWVDCRDTWEDIWNQLAKIEKELGSELAYAFSPKFGYLTSRLDDCGTALKVCAYLHLPALNHTGQLRSLLHNVEDVIGTSMEGNLDHILGDFLLVKNAYNLGVSEEDILRAVHLAATKLVGAEQAARTRIVNENDITIKDHISRSYGLLMHSYQLDTRETLSALSMIKLGINLGWIDGLTDEEINSIYLQVRRAHLLKSLQEVTEDRQAIQRARAAFIHKCFKNVKLKEILL